MSLIDAVIPGVFGLVLLLRPEAMFVGSKVEPDAARLRLLRRLGWVLVGVACLFAVLALVEP